LKPPQRDTYRANVAILMQNTKFFAQKRGEGREVGGGGGEFREVREIRDFTRLPSVCYFFGLPFWGGCD
jgi:hypothetical protein